MSPRLDSIWRLSTVTNLFISRLGPWHYGWDGKFLIPRNIHIVICIFSGLPSGQTAAGPRLSVAARTVPAYCVLSVLTWDVGDGTHLASSGRPSCPHPSTWSAASWPPQPPAASRACSPLALAASPSLLVSRPRVSVQGLLVTSLVLAVCSWLLSPMCVVLCLPLNWQHRAGQLEPSIAARSWHRHRQLSAAVTHTATAETRKYTRKKYM